MSAKEDRVVGKLKRVSSGIPHINIGDADTGTYSETTDQLYKDPAYGLPSGYIWVRRNGSRHATRARNVNGVAPLHLVNYPVVVGENRRDGGLDIIGINWEKVRERFGDAAYASAQQRHTHVARDIEDGRIYLAEAGSLTFRAKPFIYLDSDGNRQEWPDNIGSGVTITNTCASGEHQVVVIALDTAAGAAQLTITASTPVNVSTGLSRASALAVTLATGYKPLGAIHLYYGDMTPRGEDHVWDLREWLEGSGGGTESPLTTKGDLYTFDTDNARFALGTDGQFLRARPSEPTGLKWESVALGNGLTVTKVLRETSSVLYDDALASDGNFDVDLSAIAATASCTHLLIRGFFRSSASGSPDQINIVINSDTTATNYRNAQDFGGSTTGGGTNDTARVHFAPPNSATAGVYGVFTVFIPNFRDSNYKRYIVAEGQYGGLNTTIYMSDYAGIWESTAAITRIGFQPSNYPTNTLKAQSRLEIIGLTQEYVVTDVTGGMAEYSTANTSNPPTAAELNAAFGLPSDLGPGFIGLLNDDGADANVWLALSTGAKWFYTDMTEAI